MIYFFPSIKLLVELHNVARSKKLLFALKPLIFNDDLMKYAQLWSDTMSKEETLKHGDMPMPNILKTEHKYYAENIAMGQHNEKDVMASWMSSPKHRANILNRHFNSIGAAFSYSKQDQIYWCVCFGSGTSKK